MINPNRDASEDNLRMAKEESYERYKLQIFSSVEQLLSDFEITWDDLAAELQWPWNFFDPPQYQTGEQVKKLIGSVEMTDKMLNDVASVFSAEPYIMFRPRWPWVAS